MKKKLLALSLLASSQASMAAVDATATAAEISANSTAIEAVGTAFLALAALAVGFKWIKGMIFS